MTFGLGAYIEGGRRAVSSSTEGLSADQLYRLLVVQNTTEKIPIYNSAKPWTFSVPSLAAEDVNTAL
jgi:hypothetical protein